VVDYTKIGYWPFQDGEEVNIYNGDRAVIVHKEENYSNNTISKVWVEKVDDRGRGWFYSPSTILTLNGYKQEEEDE
jgi:hypothetical protein